MGEISEMMLDGTMCADCGTYIEPKKQGEAEGIPRKCNDCLGIFFSECCKARIKNPDDVGTGICTKCNKKSDCYYE